MGGSPDRSDANRIDAMLVTGEHRYVQTIPGGAHHLCIAGFTEAFGGYAQLCNDAAEDDLINTEAVQMGDRFAVAFVATKPIKKGAELLRCYDYWQKEALSVKDLISDACGSLDEAARQSTLDAYTSARHKGLAAYLHRFAVVRAISLTQKKGSKCLSTQ